MLRRVLLAVCFCSCALVLGLGCDSGGSKDTNPNNLEYSKDGPPKRDGVKGGKTK
jgi:hypothetical protein